MNLRSQLRWGQVGWGALALLLPGSNVAWAGAVDQSDALASASRNMHIMEGFLPPLWAAIWFAVTFPFWIIGVRQIAKLIAEKPETRLLLGVAGAFSFVLSALKIPSVTDSSSQMDGGRVGADGSPQHVFTDAATLERTGLGAVVAELMPER